MSETPICDFISEYQKKSPLRFHMPGHKGVPHLGCEPLDITEIRGADSLYEADGIIAKSEKCATETFGFGKTLYSTEGSSQCIKAMIYLALQSATLAKNKSRSILAARNAHKAFIHACALIDIEPVWLYPETDSGSLCSCPVSEKSVFMALSALAERGRLPFAVYITSPDYLGRLADIRGIAGVCREFGVPLLVDNAHGAYLKFLSPSLHPIDLGAFMSCDSAHKTLPVLTGGAYLHFAKDVPAEISRRAKQALSMFGSTSPSYLILQSLDLCNALLSGEYRTRLADTIKNVATAKNTLKDAGWKVFDGEEPLKITLELQNTKETGKSVAGRLSNAGIECEYADEDYVVFMVSADNTPKELKRLCGILGSAPPRSEELSESTAGGFVFPQNERAMSVRDAIMAPSEEVPVALSIGRICASPTSACPPAIPIAVSGERISKMCAEMLGRYGHEKIEVVIE